MKKLIVLTLLLLGASTPALAGGIDVRIGVDLGPVGVRVAAPHHRHGRYCGHRGYYPGYYGYYPERRVIERVYVPGEYYYRDRRYGHDRHWRQHRREYRREHRREHRRQHRREARREHRREHRRDRHDGHHDRAHDRDRHRRPAAPRQPDGLLRQGEGRVIRSIR